MIWITSTPLWDVLWSMKRSLGMLYTWHPVVVYHHEQYQKFEARRHYQVRAFMQEFEAFMPFAKTPEDHTTQRQKFPLNFGLTLFFLYVILLIACYLQSCRVKFLILFCFPNSNFIPFHFVPLVVFVLSIILIQDRVSWLSNVSFRFLFALERV